MAIDEILVATGHDHRHGDEKICKWAWRGTNEAYSRCRCLVAWQVRSWGWLGGCSHLKARPQISQRKLTRPWRFHKTTGGGPGALFFCPPMPEPEEGPSRTPLGGHLANYGLLNRNAASRVAPPTAGESAGIRFSCRKNLALLAWR